MTQRKYYRKKFNLDNFNKKFEDVIDKELKKEKKLKNKKGYIFKQDLEDEKIYNDVNKLNIENVIIEIRNIFYFSLKYISEKKNPMNYILSTPRRKYCASILIIILGCLLLLFSTLMMEKSL